MSLIIVGTTALDSIKTPYSENPRLLGGSASHAAVAASFFTSPQLLGIVGNDFPNEYIDLYKKHRIQIDGLEQAEGKTFHWSGEYEVNMNNRRTLETELGVIEKFNPVLNEKQRAAKYVLLANCAPQLQHHVLKQIDKPEFVIVDTMDLWLNIAREELLKLLGHVDCLVLNDSEAHLFTEEDNIVVAAKKLHAAGPRYVIVKKGEHGAILSSPNGYFLSPAYPLENVIDPTGAGDSFVGGLIGYLANNPDGDIEERLRRGMIYGSVTASFCCQGFGLNTTTQITRHDIDSRMDQLRKMTTY
ncbi:MAG: PfkB family carbohydrate kinase [Verrucomicrobia bacterium]|nr:PfkB family carbohydrate kinase [Verrucomicrobiota bacterium]